MSLTAPALSAGFALPDWLRAEIAALPDRLPDPDERMRLVTSLAARNIAEGTGGPFAALVVESLTGEVVSVGVNLVLSSQLAIAHAEVVTLALAQSRVGSWNLGAGAGRLLVVDAQPCAMCLGALI